MLVWRNRMNMQIQVIKNVAGCVIGGGFLLLCFGCSPGLLVTSGSPSVSCSNNLAQIYIVLKDAVGPSGAYFPKTLGDLSNNPDPNLFICSGAESRPGKMTDIVEWTDLIYVGNLTDSFIMGAALMISPPENHGGVYGYVLFSDGRVERLPAGQIRQLINDPFMMATLEVSPSDTSYNIEHEKKRAIVNVPKRLNKYYKPSH